MDKSAGQKQAGVSTVMGRGRRCLVTIKVWWCCGSGGGGGDGGGKPVCVVRAGRASVVLGTEPLGLPAPARGASELRGIHPPA